MTLVNDYILSITGEVLYHNQPLPNASLLMIKKPLNRPKYTSNRCQSSVCYQLDDSQKLQPLPMLNDVNITGKKLSGAIIGRIIIGGAIKSQLLAASSVITFIMLQSIMTLPAQAASARSPGHKVLMVEMTPALCKLQPTRARMRQCLEGYSLTVSGLDLGYGSRCGNGSEPRLTPLQLKVVNRIMPDITVRSQAWQRHGACSPLSANSYFRQIVTLASQLKLPSELHTGNSYTVSKSRFISQMTRLNSGMTSSSVDLICQDGNRRQSILTDIHVCYDGSRFGSCSNTINNCGKNFIISGGK